MALTRRALGGITIGGSAALTLAACGGNQGGGADNDAELVWAVSYAWEAWYMTTTTGNNSATNQAMSAMTPAGKIGYDFDPEGNIFYDDAIFAGAPELVSEEPMTLKYTLTEGAQWSDGKPVRVEDFIFYWYSMSGNKDHANQELAIPSSTDWGANVASIEQAEDGTIVVTYVDGYIDPEWAFTGGVHAPSHYAEENGFEDWQNDPDVMGEAIKWFNENLWTVVTGPYKPKTLEDGKPDAKLGEYVKYEINDKYMGSVKPTIKNFTTRTVETLANEVTELRQGSIVGCWPNEFLLEELEKLDEAEEFKYETYAGSTWSHLDLNFKNEFLADLPLRQAVLTAIDNVDLAAKIYPGTEVPWKGNHFFNEGDANYVDYIGETTLGSGDIEAANQILTDAGYQGVGDALKTKDGKEVTFNFRYADDSEPAKLMGELIQSYLAGIGIDLELKSFATDEFAAVLSEAKFDLMSFAWVSDPAFTVGPGQFFASDSGSNYGSYSNPEVDEAITKVRSTFDLDEAADFANQVGELATADAYMIPLYQRPLSVIWNSNLVEGVEVNGNSQSGPLYNVRDWKRP
ncbi:ABC transporter substrate-binding protein [Glycomyces buryatensis]|nr:ABC transporter substrate-binding protein [Glycomyces buryatensis]